MPKAKSYGLDHDPVHVSDAMNVWALQRKHDRIRPRPTPGRACRDYWPPGFIGSTSHTTCRHRCLRRLIRTSTTVADVWPVITITIGNSSRSSNGRTNYASRFVISPTLPMAIRVGCSYTIRKVNVGFLYSAAYVNNRSSALYNLGSGSWLANVFGWCIFCR